MLEIPLLYKDRRLEGETPLRQCQLVQLHLLYVFDAICKEHKLTYFLGGGTLLGAMRHDGFIPWDDDLDVGMPMRDYKRFLKIAKEALPKDVLLQTPKTNPYTALAYSKLRDAYSFYFEPRRDMSMADVSGIYLDIFPYEEMPEVGSAFKKLLLRGCYSTWFRAKDLQIYCRNLPTKLVAFPYYLALRLTHYLVRFFILILKGFVPAKTTYPGFNTGYYIPFCKAKIYPTRMKRFEDGEFPVPNDPDAFLTGQYGDWRAIPPPEKRPRHATIIHPTQAPDLPWAMRYQADGQMNG